MLRGLASSTERLVEKYVHTRRVYKAAHSQHITHCTGDWRDAACQVGESAATCMAWPGHGLTGEKTLVAAEAVLRGIASNHYSTIG